MVLRSDGVSGYVLDAYGGAHPFGGAPNVALSTYWYIFIAQLIHLLLTLTRLGLAGI